MQECSSSPSLHAPCPPSRPWPWWTQTSQVVKKNEPPPLNHQVSGLQINHKILPLPLHQIYIGIVQITKEASKPSLKCDDLPLLLLGESSFLHISPFFLLVKYLNIPSILHLKKLRGVVCKTGRGDNFPLSLHEVGLWRWGRVHLQTHSTSHSLGGEGGAWSQPPPPLSSSLETKEANRPWRMTIFLCWPSWAPYEQSPPHITKSSTLVLIEFPGCFSNVRVTVSTLPPQYPGQSWSNRNPKKKKVSQRRGWSNTNNNLPTDARQIFFHVFYLNIIHPSPPPPPFLSSSCQGGRRSPASSCWALVARTSSCTRFTLHPTSRGASVLIQHHLPLLLNRPPGPAVHEHGTPPPGWCRGGRSWRRTSSTPLIMIWRTKID